MYHCVMVSTNDLIAQLEEISPDGFELSCKFGVLTSTKAIYIKNSKIYLFNIEDKFSFNKKHGYNKEEFLAEYANYYWEIEFTIS